MRKYSPENYSITVPSSQDAEDILKLRREVFREELSHSTITRDSILVHTADWANKLSVAQFRSTLKEWTSDPTMMYRTVTRQNETVGVFKGLLPDEDMPYNFIAVIQLRQDARRQGIGRMLLQTFDEFADHTAPTRLQVITANSPAIRFYEQMGFAATYEVSRFKIAEEFVPTTYMERPPLDP